MNNLKQDKEDANEMIRNLTHDLQDTIEKLMELEKISFYQKDYNKRNILQIIGLAEQPGETWARTAEYASSFLDRKLQLLKMETERVYRISQRREQ